jgi:hypothetical protein
MKPRIRSALWTDVQSGATRRRWHVEFEDSCGCMEEEDFPTFGAASRFANHMAGGGSRWEFVA